MCDGNRRWARTPGLTDVSKGHRKGADKIFELLEWCKETGVEVVTLWLLSTDNLSRPREELDPAAEDHRGHRHRAGRRGLAGEPDGRSGPAARRHGPGPQARRRDDRATIRACSSTSPSATAAAARSPTPSARCCTTTRAGAPRSRSWPRSSTSSTSPSTCTRRASPTPTSSSAPAASSASAGSCYGSRPTPSSTSATPTGPRSARLTSCGRCAPIAERNRRFGA